MKYIDNGTPADDLPVIELTRRNLEILLAKLDDPLSARTIGRDGVWVRAVENDDHYAAEDRSPGAMYMPSTGEIR